MYFMVFIIVFTIVGMFNTFYVQNLMKFFAWLMDKGVVPYYEMDFRFEGHLQSYLLIAEIVVFVVGYLLYSRHSYNKEKKRKELIK